MPASVNVEHIKYPRTEHFSSVELLSSQTLIVEEKMDGTGLGIGFKDGIPYVQQRGHIFLLHQVPDYLRGIVSWLNDREELLYELIGENYILFGEWLQYKHTHFYDKLPDYFLEYDIYDKQQQYFLSTLARQQLISDNKHWLHSVYVVDSINTTHINNVNYKHFIDLDKIKTLVEKSQLSVFKTENIVSHFHQTYQYTKNLEAVLNNSILNQSYEGFYIKIENAHSVVSRYKYINKEFLHKIINGEHWKNSPLIENVVVDKNNYHYRMKL